MPLKDAIYMSPESGVLFYTLGKIYIVCVKGRKGRGGAGLG